MALQSNGVALPNANVCEELLKKHSQATPETDGCQTLPPRQYPPTSMELFTTSEVFKAVSKFPRASAAGGSGLSAAYLEELLSVPCTEQETGLAPGLAKLLTRLARGKTPAALAPWIAPLTALLNPDKSVRPVAVGETLRRLVSSMLMTRVAKRAKEVLEPYQLRVVTKGGKEAIINPTRRLKDCFGSNKFYALLKLDLRNAVELLSLSRCGITSPNSTPGYNIVIRQTAPVGWRASLPKRYGRATRRPARAAAFQPSVAAKEWLHRHASLNNCMGCHCVGQTAHERMCIRVPSTDC